MLVAPLGGASVASGSTTSTVVFGAPAVGSNGVYSDSVTYPSAYSVPPVSDGHPNDTFTFALSGTNSAHCSIASDGSNFSYTAVGVCTIVATSVGSDFDQGIGGGDGNVSGGATGTLSLTVKQPLLSQNITAVTLSGTFGVALTLQATGYAGTGAISYQTLSGGSANGCSVDAAGQLVSTSAGTCLVTATIAADAVYLGATSPPATITLIAPAVPAVPVTLTITAASATVLAGSRVTPSATVSGLTGADQASVTSATFTYTGAGATSYGPSTSAPSGAGTFAVEPSAARVALSPSSDAAKYATTYRYVAGTLTITGRVLSVTAHGAHLVVGKTVVPSATVSGLTGTDQASVTSATYTYTGTGATSYTPSTIVPSATGTYAVVPSAATVVVSPAADQSRYSPKYRYVPGTLTITALVLKIVASPPRLAPTRLLTVAPFGEGSYQLNRKLLAQIERLALAVRRGHYHVIALAGYTDNVFTPAFNAMLIQSRAQAVAAQLSRDLAALKVTGVTITISLGLSIQLVDSNTTARGRGHNRRVVATLRAR